MPFASEARGLTKTFPPDRTAVDAIEFAIDDRECFGFLGPNGAGKTTTMRMLFGRLRRTAGDLHVLGLDPDRQTREVRCRIGVVTHEDLQYLVKHRFGRWSQLALLGSILAVTVITIAADLEAGAAALGLLTHLPSRWFVIPLAALVLGLLFVGSYDEVQGVLRYVLLPALCDAQGVEHRVDRDRVDRAAQRQMDRHQHRAQLIVGEHHPHGHAAGFRLQVTAMGHWRPLRSGAL